MLGGAGTTQRAPMRAKEMTMRTSLHGGSATIYQFPQRGRFATSPPREEPAASPTPRAPAIAFGSWYHEEAIEAERTRKN
jgi:uncharacterized protein DUF2735